MLHSTLSRSQYDFTLPQVSFTSSGFHKHITLTFNPTVRLRPPVLGSKRHSSRLSIGRRVVAG